MVKPDEKALMVGLYELWLEPRPPTCARDLVEELGMCEQRARFLFEKWGRRDWYEFGVTMDLGWLTPAGREVAARYLLEDTLPSVRCSTSVTTKIEWMIEVDEGRYPLSEADLLDSIGCGEFYHPSTGDRVFTFRLHGDSKHAGPGPCLAYREYGLVCRVGLEGHDGDHGPRAGSL